MNLPPLLILARARQGIAHSAEIGLRLCEVASGIVDKSDIAFGFHNAAGNCVNPSFEGKRVKEVMAFGLPSDPREVKEMMDARASAVGLGYRHVDYTGAMVDKPGFTWVGLRYGGWRRASVRVRPDQTVEYGETLCPFEIADSRTIPAVVFFDASHSQIGRPWLKQMSGELCVPIGVEPGPVPDEDEQPGAIGHPDTPTIMRWGAKVEGRDFYLADEVHPHTYPLVMDKPQYDDTEGMKIVGRKGGCLAVMSLGNAEDKVARLVEAWAAGRAER